jgi:pimeloyl-ACP methyl ester carboxylesterase
MINNKYVQTKDAEVFYREDGDASKPTILLLHGYPSVRL